MNELLRTFEMLAAATLDDPLLELANAVVWLDPLWRTRFDDEYDEEDKLAMGLSITRSVFPEIYVSAIERIRSGASEEELGNFICREISQVGIPVDDLDWLGYGIPLDACGINLDDPNLYDTHPQLLPVVNLFGIYPTKPTNYEIEVPDCIYTAGRIIVDSLMQQDDKQLKQVGQALAWLFSCSGNTLIDFDNGSIVDIPPLTWDKENLACAIELIEESNAIMMDVGDGLTLLKANPALFTTLEANIKRIFKALAEQKGKQNEPRVQLEWSPLVAGNDGAALADPELLQLRHNAT